MKSDIGVCDVCIGLFFKWLHIDLHVFVSVCGVMVAESWVMCNDMFTGLFAMMCSFEFVISLRVFSAYIYVYLRCVLTSACIYFNGCTETCLVTFVNPFMCSWQKLIFTRLCVCVCVCSASRRSERGSKRPND